ncbi:MAG: molybdopterin oxidoreductase family protein [Alphaproteobacteria bacterium]|nr:molybdopterin oxidoreductase family protein [Alphaproteobacteria bacterium]
MLSLLIPRRLQQAGPGSSGKWHCLRAGPLAKLPATRSRSAAVSYVPSVCPHDCPSACALEVERLGPDRIGKVRGAAQPYTDGVICAKVSRYAERVHHPDRLRQPLRRVGPKGSGRFEPIAWDDALDLLAAKFVEARDGFGAESIWPYHYAGTMGHVQRGAAKRLRHALGASLQGETICSTIAESGWMAGAGRKLGTDPREMAQSDVIVLWGTNAASTQIQVMSWFAKARRARGTKLVVVDPYRTATAERADLHLMLRPGTDAALACAVMHVLFAEGYADRDYLERHTARWQDFEAHLRPRDPAWAEAITGVPADSIIAFARMYGATKRSFLRLGMGFTRSRLGAVSMHAASCLPAVTGAWTVEGGGALWNPSGVVALDRTLLDAADLARPGVRGIDMCRIGPALTGDRRDLGEGPPVKAMLVQNSNPASVAPDSTLVRRGLEREDLFLCVHEQFMTDTARMADLVLPATTFLEHDDLYTSYGTPFLQVARAVIEPFAESRDNHDVVCALASRLGIDHPAFQMSGWQMIDATLRASNLPGAEEAASMRWIDCAKSFETMHFLDGFGTPDGRFRFKPDWAAAGAGDASVLPEWPDWLPIDEQADAEHPFRLVTAPARDFLNSTFTETATARRSEARPTVMVHPDDLAAAGLKDGQLVRLGNRRGAVALHARAFDGLQRGVLVAESIWPNGAFVEGIGINALTGAEPAPPRGGGLFHDTAVWLRGASA